jgi:hypothetical protein
MTERRCYDAGLEDEGGDHETRKIRSTALQDEKGKHTDFPM